MWCVLVVARDKVANVLLAYQVRKNTGGAMQAAQDIARNAARELLGPLIDTACARLGNVLRRCLDIATESATHLKGSPFGP